MKKLHNKTALNMPEGSKLKSLTPFALEPNDRDKSLDKKANAILNICKGMSLRDFYDIREVLDNKIRESAIVK